jgi:hypothetical protein
MELALCQFTSPLMTNPIPIIQHCGVAEAWRVDALSRPPYGRTSTRRHRIRPAAPRSSPCVVVGISGPDGGPSGLRAAPAWIPMHRGVKASLRRFAALTPLSLASAPNVLGEALPTTARMEVRGGSYRSIASPMWVRRLGASATSGPPPPLARSRHDARVGRPGHVWATAALGPEPR